MRTIARNSDSDSPQSMQMGLLGASLAIGKGLERSRVNWMSEAGVALLVGMLCGLVVMLASSHLQYDFYSVFHFDVRSCPCHSGDALGAKTW